MHLNKKIFLAIFIALISYLGHHYYFKIEYSPEVQIFQGKIRGFAQKSRNGKEFYKFLGIPYAEEPIKNLRFQPPIPVNSWNEVRNTISYGSVCIQIDILTRKITGREACLFLNVFVPKNALLRYKDHVKLPVIFYIHGGYFMTGSSNNMGEQYLLDEDIILVTVNYRLNVFGFLNTGDGIVNGNMGLKDQLLALKWTKNNIESFSGDPERITIAGQSAGSAAVHFHILSDASKGLFNSAIMSSGTAIKPWSLVDNPKEQAMHLANLLNCPTSSGKEIVTCLRSLEPENIVNSIKDAINDPIMNPLEIFAPSIEVSSSQNPFLSFHPYDILRSGNSSIIPILTGCNSEEGLLATARILKNKDLLEKVEKNWNELSPSFFFYNQRLQSVTSAIRKFYMNGDDVTNNHIDFNKNFQNLTNAFSDRLYIHSTREMAKIQSEFSPVYLYYFKYPLKKGLVYLYDINPGWPIVIQFIFKEIIWFIREHIFQQQTPSLGSIHGEDIVLVFKIPLINISPGSEDYPISRQMVKMWVDFATRPNEFTFNGKDWPSQKYKEPLKYMLISKDKNHGSLINEPFSDRMQFWDKVNIPWKEPLGLI